MLLLSTALALPPATTTWNTIQSTPVKIECTQVGTAPWCRSTGVIGAPVSTAVSVFAELDKYVSKMGAITLVERLAPDILHVVMDYPTPLSDRDYVARFTRTSAADGSTTFAWTPVEHPSAPPTSAIVRLSWLEGEWKFAPEGSNTRVTYLWQADPGGNLPNVESVWKKAGTLAITDIANACGTTITGP